MSKMSIVRVLTMPVAAGMLFFGTVAGAAEIRVLISGGFSAALAELKPEFERATGHRLVITRAASMGSAPETIPSRLQRGEPIDVVIMVGSALDRLMAQGQLVPGSKVVLADSRIACAVATGAPHPDLSTVAKVRDTLTGAPAA